MRPSGQTTGITHDARGIGLVAQAAWITLATCLLSCTLATTFFARVKTYPVLLQPIDGALNIPGELFRGNPGAAITFVEASDFECRACAASQRAVREFSQRHSSDVKMAFVPYPEAGADYLKVFSKAYLAALRQHKGEEMKQALFKSGGVTTNDPGEAMSQALAEAFRVAGDLRLNLDAFQKDLYSDSLAALLDTLADQVRSAGAKATPTYFINGYRFEGGLGVEGYETVLRRFIGGDLARK